MEHGTDLAQQLVALWAATTQLRATVLALLQSGRPGVAQVGACHPFSLEHLWNQHGSRRRQLAPSQLIVAGLAHATESSKLAAEAHNAVMAVIMIVYHCEDHHGTRQKPQLRTICKSRPLAINTAITD